MEIQVRLQTERSKMAKVKANEMTIRNFKKSTFQVNLTGEQIIFIKDSMDRVSADLFNDFFRIEDMKDFPRKERTKLYNSAHNYNNMKDWVEISLDVSDKIALEKLNG